MTWPISFSRPAMSRRLAPLLWSLETTGYMSVYAFCDSGLRAACLYVEIILPRLADFVTRCRLPEVREK